MTRRQRRHFRRALLAIVLLILAAVLLSFTQAQDRDWTYRVWDNGDVAITPPQVEVWGLTELREHQWAEPPTHGTVAFYVDGPCWRVQATSEERSWMWQDLSGCARYWLPFVGIK